jgi:predicted DNA-binding transcriptional regulator AlpA
VVDCGNRFEVARVSAKTIDGFARSYGISRSMFYLLQQEGKAPRIFKIGRLTRISEEAERDWVRAREREAAEPTMSGNEDGGQAQ